MKVTFGIKAHSGWAALVVVGRHAGDLVVADRRRLELVEEAWARQPYHAAETLAPAAARKVVERGVEAARRIAAREIRAAASRERERNNEVAACAVLVSSPMPEWSTEEILAVHFRMHKAEGVLFKEALARGVRWCGPRLVAIPEKQLAERAEAALSLPISDLAKTIGALGKAVGPPWGKDQKDAALAALVALEGRGRP